ncbi:MAG: efflux RND transporter periplasmic adaptor subunit [Gammaproteobacteria bacterium]
MIRVLKIVLPVAALLVAIVVSYLLFLTRPKVEHQQVEATIPLVSVAPAKAQSLNIPVYTRGTVSPGTQIQLMSEVSGQVLEVSPNFANGGFFSKGDVLVRVDTLEYDVNIKRAEAAVAQAYQAYLQAEAEKKARSRVRGNNNALANFEVQFRQAEASYLASKAELEAVKLQRERAVVRAPFDGRVLMAAVNVGQYLRPGLQMGVIYAVDVAEVRLPLSDRQLSLVDVPGRLTADQAGKLPEVIISEEYAGKTYTWRGQVVRAEGGLDERNRLLYLVAHVTDPYGVDPAQPGRPELVAGSFVEAKIAGRRFERIYPIPRRALRHGSQLWVVGDDGRLDKREVGVLYKSKDTIYVTTGIDDGDQVVLSQLDIAVDGMRVRTQQENTPEEIEEVKTEQNPFAGRSPVSEAIREAVTVTDKGATLNVSASQAMELASKAKDLVNGLDEKQKQQLKDSANKVADQIKAMQQNAARQKVAEPEPVEPVKPAAETAAMSPLASQLEADIAAQTDAVEQAPAAEAEIEAAIETEPAVKPAPKTDLLANSEKSTTSRGIATVVAPKPLLEATQ